MKNYILFCLALLPYFLFSCMEDKGTYDYVEVNELTIDTIHNQVIEIYDTLRIKSMVKSTTEDAAPLEYVWYRYINESLKVDTLSVTESLEYKVALGIGTYEIILKVTDMNTGLSAKETFKLKVVGKFDNGLMVLGEVKGQPSLVFINNAGNITDMYNTSNASLLGKNPVAVANAVCPNISYIKDIMVLCDDGFGGVALSAADFSVNKPYKDLFFLAPESVKPQAYYRGMSHYGWTNADFIISGGKLHARMLGYAEELKRKTAFNPAVPGDYELSPYAIVSAKDYLFYDNKNERFLVIRGDFMSMSATFSTLVSATSEFNPSKVGMKLIYMSEAAPEGSTKRGMGIFRDQNNQLQRLVFTLNKFSDMIKIQPIKLLSKTEVTVAEGIDQASAYAMSLAHPFLYYSKGSKIYLYEWENNISTPVYDVDTVIDNSTIDKIYIEYVASGGYGSKSDIYNTVMYVASSENGKSGQNGSIHVLKLAMNGIVEKRTAFYPNVCGKTVSLCYKR